MPKKKKTIQELLAEMPVPRDDSHEARIEWIRGPFRERMLNDPEFRTRWMRHCGYRKHKDGSVYVIPV